MDTASSQPNADGAAAPVCIAIDGPSASGKSTVARRVAGELGFFYVDSGALYRGITWMALEMGVDCGSPDAVVMMLSCIRCEHRIAGRSIGFALDGREPGAAIRSEAVAAGVSEIAAIPAVRAFVVDRLRECARYGSLVMEGRDIGTVVFPETPFKFYLDADPEERARRRLHDRASGEGHGDAAAVRDSLARRDRRDSTRASAPLQIALNARVIDSTRLSIDEVVRVVTEAVRSGGGAR